MPHKPKIFIGSASESRKDAEALQRALEIRDQMTPEIWTTSFDLGKTTIDELRKMSEGVDFAAFILGQDDKTNFRGKTTFSPRDNVIYEAGLFAGKLGVEKVFLLVNSNGTKIPSDLAGLSYLTYEASGTSGTDAMRGPATKISLAATKIIEELEKTTPRQAAGHWWQYALNRTENSVVSLMHIEVDDTKSSLRIEGQSWTQEGKIIAEYRSRGVTIDHSSHSIFYYWEGSHPSHQNIAQFCGIGEVSLKRLNNLTNEAKGWYTELLVTDIHQQKRISTIYFRAKPEEVEIMKHSGDMKKIKKLVNEKISNWKVMREEYSGGTI